MEIPVCESQIDSIDLFGAMRAFENNYSSRYLQRWQWMRTDAQAKYANFLDLISKFTSAINSCPVPSTIARLRDHVCW